MIEKLSNEEKKYPEERGFKYTKNAEEVTTYPYVELGELGKYIDNSPIKYCKNSCISTRSGKPLHPSTTSDDELISNIEKIVAMNIYHDGVFFNTEPGQPILILGVDDSWDNVGMMIETKYMKVDKQNPN